MSKTDPQKQTEGAEQPQAEGEKKVPLWARQPFLEFFDFVGNIREITSIAAGGIAVAQNHPKWVTLLGAEGVPNYDSRLRKAEERAALAKREIENDFPLLHTQMIVGLWSALENLTYNLLVAWLLHDRKQVLIHERVQALKVPIGEYAQLSHEEQAEYLADLLDRSLGAPLKEGATRFDAVLDILNLSSSLSAQTRDAIFEMGQVRNVIVHRGGVVDRRFVEKCPRLGLKVGDRLLVSKTSVSRYYDAAVDYAGTRLTRTFEVFGVQIKVEAEDED